jgi:hypothetical protein
MNPNIQRRMMEGLAVAGRVEDMIGENVPGIECRTREEIELIVRRVHSETPTT